MKKSNLLVLALFLLLVLLFTWPLVAHLNDGVAGGKIDTLLNSWILSWDAHAITHSPFSFFQANINYPSVSSLAFSEHMFTLAVLGLPLHWLGANPVLVHNLLLILGLIFSAFTAFLLVEYLTGNRYAAFAAGAFFALCPYHLSKIAHLHISFLAFLPLVLLFLLKYLDGGGRKYLALFGLVVLAQALTSWYLMAFMLLAVAAALVGRLIFRWRDQAKRVLLAVGTMAVCGIIILPFALPYLRNQSSYPDFDRPLSEIALYSAKPGDYLNVPPENVVYGSLGSPFRTREIGIGYDAERTLFPGLVILLLAAFALVPPLRKRREEGGKRGWDGYKMRVATDADSRQSEEGGNREWEDYKSTILPFAALGLFAILLSFGPYIGGKRNPFFLLLYHSGIFSFVRMPARYAVLLILALAVLGGYGLARIMDRLRERPGRSAQFLGIGLAGLLLLEMLTVGVPVSRVPVGKDISGVYTELNGQEEGAVIDAPVSGLLGAVTYEGMFPISAVNSQEYIDHENLSIYFSTLNWSKLVNGFSGYYPPFYRRVMMEMQAFPSTRTISFLAAAGVKYVAWHWDWLDADTAAAYRGRLAGFPQLETVAEDQGVALIHIGDTGGTAGLSDLDWRLDAPQEAAAASPIRLGIRLENRTERAFATVEERAKTVQVTWRDPAGNVVRESVEEYFLPFYLEPGGQDQISFVTETPREPGDYTLDLALGDDGSRELGPVTMSVAAGAQAVDAKAAGQVVSAGVSGAYPVTASALFGLGLTLRNTGPVPLVSTKAGGPGTIDLGFTWMRDGEQVWEVQRATLPCDVSPGQGISAAALLRAPIAPGTYTLRCQLVKEGYYWFDDFLEVTIQVEGPQP